ncbi:FlgO family outer membrane protein [Alteromonas ponticola]|uniref:FlgO family outer membrane protein n=1 Tax=Alteromonas aquimaris TaxID=2998417 RepID=A0ABT3P6G6_9ALTE|nr:FlgO family outer membrane protein [Alteromonas aquimaris]MCW8108319.1 FlgO family outer membrane protein [Alteromonas aquimaris]
MANRQRMLRNFLLITATMFSGLVVTGCGLLPDFYGSEPNPAPVKKAVTATGEPVSALGNVEYYTFTLANELFANLRPSRQVRYAVTGFVPVTTMAYNNDDQHPLMLLGHQLEQGLVTEATKRGFLAQEYKLTDNIIMTDHAERVLTRNIDQLSVIDRVDYYITGTVVKQESGAMVNARIIDANSKEIISAATRFFPAEVFWQKEHVTTRNGRLYRSEIKG